MKSISRLALLFLGLVAMTTTIQSCKKNFDEPPVEEYPVLTPNATISQIKALHTVGNSPSLINDSLVIEGIVVSSDEKGNFYKQLIIQDDSAGIEIRIEMSSLYTDYPVGRRVWVKCKGLFVGDYQGNHQLTINDAGDRIPEGMLPQFIVAGAKDQPLVPKTVTIAELKTTVKYRNMLVQLNDVQFATVDTNQNFADAVGGLSVNRSINDCSGNTVLLRSSGYATFASDKTPLGNGIAVGVHSSFGTDAQLYIREPNDLTMGNTRCTVSVGGNLITIAAMRATFGGTIPTNSKINGYVISDRTTANLVSQNMVVMDATGGITIRFSSTHSFNEGDQVEIPLDGGTLSEFNGLMQLEGISSGAVSVVSTGNAVPPTTVTLSALNASPETYESRLIKISNATITGGTTYSGTLDLNDATGTIDLFTRFGATFAANPVPCGTLEVVGILGQFTSYQFQLRDPAYDVTGGTPCGGNATLANISDVRAQYTGAPGTVSGSIKIRGVVISDRAGANMISQNLVIQDSLGFGVTVRFTATHSINLGDKIEVNITGATLEEFNGLLQVNNLGLTSSTTVSTGNTVTPRVATVDQVIANAEDWESTLITVQGVVISGPTYGFSNTITDATGSVTLYTRTGATFSGTAITAGTVNVTAILSQFDSSVPYTSGYQMLMRNLNDVTP
jgi:hypothetical protein